MYVGDEQTQVKHPFKVKKVVRFAQNKFCNCKNSPSYDTVLQLSHKHNGLSTLGLLFYRDNLCLRCWFVLLSRCFDTSKRSYFPKREEGENDNSGLNHDF